MPHDGFEKLASIDDIPEEGVLAVVRSDGQRICLIRSRGKVSAVSNTCTHQEFEMSLGDVLPDGTIQCAWHGARFDCSTRFVKIHEPLKAPRGAVMEFPRGGSTVLPRVVGTPGATDGGTAGESGATRTSVTWASLATAGAAGCLSLTA